MGEEVTMADYEIIDIIRGEDDILVAELMDETMKRQVLEYEMRRLKEIVPFVNKGLNDAMQEDEAIVIIKKARMDENYDPDDDGSFTLRTESGKIIGEMVYDEEELEELRDDPCAFFLSDNFVTYSDPTRTTGEKQFFVMESAKTTLVTDKNIKDTVSTLTVAIPSTETDHYIRDCFELSDDTELVTVIIGFTPIT